MARLILKFKDRILQVYPLRQDQHVAIGRRSTNDIVIDNLAVSGHHARIENSADGFTITDLQSKNGTFLNGEPVLEGVLKDQDVVTVGKHTLVADLTDSLAVEDSMDQPDERQEPTASFDDSQTMLLDTSAARRMRGEEMSPPPAPEPVHPETDLLSVLSDPSGGNGQLALTQKPITIGKNDDADIVLQGPWSLLAGSPAVTVGKQAGDVFLRFNGGFIKPKRNGASVKGTVMLNHDDIVEVGPIKIRVQLSKRSTP